MRRALPLLAAFGLAATGATGLPAVAMARGQTAAPPSIDEAMSAICAEPAHDESCLLQGRTMRYWLSFPSGVDGRDWFTVVATAANHLAGDDGGDGDGAAMPEPSDKVRISQVTYELVDEAAGKTVGKTVGARWKLIARQTGFGSLYVNNSGNPFEMADTEHGIFTHALADGVLVGAPITQMAGEGITLHGFAMFRSAPDKSGRWLHGGDVMAGLDNHAGCDEQAEPEGCYSSYGSLALADEAKGKSALLWPAIRTTLHGTVDPKGSTRPAARALWSYDAGEAGYISSNYR